MSVLPTCSASITVATAATESTAEIVAALCDRRSVVIVKERVPGGTLKGHACLSHVDLVKRMVRDEAAKRVLAVS